MKKILLLAVAIAAATSAWADWVTVAKNEENVWLLDPNTLRVNGSSRRIWVLKEFHKPQKVGNDFLRSTKALQEHDCTEGRSRIIQVSAYRGSNGSGTHLYTSDSPWEWSYHAPDTAGSAVHDLVCNLR